MPELSLCLLTYGRYDHVSDLLCSILGAKKEGWSFEVIILDNNPFASVDYDFHVFCRALPEVRLISDGTNYGVAGGRRKLVDAANGEILIFFDDDVILPDVSSLMSSVLRVFHGNANIAAQAFNILDFRNLRNNRYEIPHCRKHRDLSRGFETYIFIGAGFAVRRNVVVGVGNFDETFSPYGFEEIDLAFRIVDSGGMIYYNPECVVIHLRSPLGRMANGRSVFLYCRNRIVFCIRYLRWQYVITNFIVLFVFLALRTRSFSFCLQFLLCCFRARRGRLFTSRFYRTIRRLGGRLIY